MTRSTSSTSSSASSSTARHWATRAAVAAASAGLIAGAFAPAANASDSQIIRHGAIQCDIHHDVRVGPVFGGYTSGNCGTHPGEHLRGADVPDRYALGQVFLPGGASYSAWVDKIW